MFLKDIGKDKRKLENTGKYCRLLQKQSQGICPPRWMLPGRWLPLLSWTSEGCFSPPDSGLGHLLVFANRVTADVMQAKAWKALALDGGGGGLVAPMAGAPLRLGRVSPLQMRPRSDPGLLAAQGATPNMWARPPEATSLGWVFQTTRTTHRSSRHVPF